MTTGNGSEMFTAGKMAEALGVSQGKVRKLIQEYEIEPDEIKRGCKYYGTATLKKLKTEVQKA
jgi:plasmid maintenance system antidote protein VapI